MNNSTINSTINSTTVVELADASSLRGLDQKGLLTKIVQVGKIDFSTNKYLIFSTQNST